MTARVPTVSRSTLLRAADEALDDYLDIELPRAKIDTWRDGGDQWHWRLSFGQGRLAVSSAGGYSSRQQAVRAFVAMVSYTVATFINEQEVVSWLKRASDPKFAREQAVAEFNRRMAEEGPRGPTAQRVTQRRLK
jgi:uncharacterized protein YegP (UPF0339 family)